MKIKKDKDCWVICENLENLMTRYELLSREMTILLSKIKKNIDNREMLRMVNKKIRDIIVYMDDIKKEINGK